MLTSSGCCISLTDKFEPGAEVKLFVIDLVYCFPLHGPRSMVVASNRCFFFPGKCTRHYCKFYVHFNCEPLIRLSLF